MVNKKKELKNDIYWRYMTINSKSENIHIENNNLNSFDINIYRKQLKEQIKKVINNPRLFYSIQ